MAETGRAERTWRRAVAAADRRDARRARPPVGESPAGPGPVAAAWGAARLAAVVAGLPVLAPTVGIAAAATTRRTLAEVERYPALVDAVLAGGRPPLPDGRLPRVGRVPAGGRWFVSSDLHRCVPGLTDWPGAQGTKGLYEAALDHYAGRGWGLVENGDVEDFWLVGGSTYGAVYDVARLVTGVWRAPRGRSLRAELFAEHLRRIVANNRGIYDRIEDGFHREGRYRRLLGNHDDAFADPALVAELGAVHPGVEVHDHLVLEDDAGAGVGLVTHGHHVDSWNAPGRDALGKLGTWLASALADAPLAGHPGIPEEEETATLLEGRLPDVLTAVSRAFGANRDLYSVDETLLFDAARRHWSPTSALDASASGAAAASGDLTGGPWLLLGHTHLPLHRPLDPRHGAEWSRYANSGAGVFTGCLTGLEWDGTADPANPEVRLVAWRDAERGRPVGDESIVVVHEGRAVVRDVLERVAPEPELQVVASGSLEATAGVHGWGAGW